MHTARFSGQEWLTFTRMFRDEHDRTLTKLRNTTDPLQVHANEEWLARINRLRDTFDAIVTAGKTDDEASQ